FLAHLQSNACELKASCLLLFKLFVDCVVSQQVHVWVSAYQHHVNKLFAMFRRKKPHINTMSAPSTNHSQCQANGW
uniref:Uncharacterized protein n=1 Tax=Aegilops tauschii subsp. strangulata TaxID=200361 RepID=A0A453S9U4_AEGTS